MPVIKDAAENRRRDIEWLRADLAALEALLNTRSPAVDPVGWLQFSQRKATVEATLAKLQDEEARG